MSFQNTVDITKNGHLDIDIYSNYALVLQIIWPTGCIPSKKMDIVSAKITLKRLHCSLVEIQ